MRSKAHKRVGVERKERKRWYKKEREKRNVPIKGGARSMKRRSKKKERKRNDLIHASRVKNLCQSLFLLS